MKNLETFGKNLFIPLYSSFNPCDIHKVARDKFLSKNSASNPKQYLSKLNNIIGEAHAPCGCKQWQEWQVKIKEVKPEELKASCSGTEDAANCLWLVTNSKPCPNCKSPIQKNEGCNHMKCSKVRSNSVEKKSYIF